MIRFTLFGVPVEVQPFFWIMGALMGGGLHADTSNELLVTALFMIAAFVSVLAHEFGHALVGRRLGGGNAQIILTGWGGLAINRGGRFTRSGHVQRILAGPGAGFALLLGIVILLCLAFGFGNAIALTGRLLFNADLPFTSSKLFEYFSEKPFVFVLVHHFMWINFWWSVINLVPVPPLDGGNLADVFMKSRKALYQLGIITAIAMAIAGYFWFGSKYMPLLFGYLAFKNFQDLRSLR